MKDTEKKHHSQFMQKAIELAAENAQKGNGGPFGAVVVKNGVIIAEGTNRVTTDNDPTAHAEVQAIRAACRALNSFQLTGCTIYSSCEPCPMCLGAIYWARPDALFYAATRTDAAKAGFDDDFIYREIPMRPEDRTLRTEHLGTEESFSPFRVWLKKDGKIEY